MAASGGGADARPILVSVTAAVVAALFAGAAQAQPTAPDTGAIKACLKRQEAALGHACIGIVADPCTDAAGGDTAKRKVCADRERAVWQAELEAALRDVRKGGFKDITGSSVTQAQKSWESSLRHYARSSARSNPARCRVTPPPAPWSRRRAERCCYVASRGR